MVWHTTHTPVYNVALGGIRTPHGHLHWVVLSSGHIARQIWPGKTISGVFSPMFFFKSRYPVEGDNIKLPILTSITNRFAIGGAQGMHQCSVYVEMTVVTIVTVGMS